MRRVRGVEHVGAVGAIDVAVLLAGPLRPRRVRALAAAFVDVCRVHVVSLIVSSVGPPCSGHLFIGQFSIFNIIKSSIFSMVSCEN